MPLAESPTELRGLSVVVPVYNERATVAEVIEKLSRSPVVTEIIVVDDASTDGSRQLLQELRRRLQFKLLLHPRNRGKGAALRTGFQVATGELVVVQDADLEYDPEDFPGLMAPLLQGRADASYGSRFLGGGLSRQSFSSYLANRLLTLLANLFTGYRLTDMETCYKMFRREKLGCLKLTEDRFGFEPEVTLELARSGCRILEVPISYGPRPRAAGKKIGARDGLRTVWVMVKRRFFPV
jgi:glycosyltransferase involved in cell wall biosynthesis